MKKLTLIIAITLVVFSCKNDPKSSEDVATESTVEGGVEEVADEIIEFKVNPISHATMVLNWNGSVIYVDPVGGAEKFEGHPKPDLILVTDIHGDHMNIETLQAVSTDKAKIMVPQAVADKLPADFDAQIDVLNNGDSKERFGFTVEAIPMYNLPEDDTSRHAKGRGNGYVIERAGKRVYISGDTEDIPEMRALKKIDVAFVCMNLPYTMTVESAADAVLEFTPKTVYPYHYRGQDGFSDVQKFADAVSEKSKNIQVEWVNWYPENN